MVAKVESEKSMVILERIDDHVYSMCSLRKDLRIKDVRSVAKMSRDKDVKLQIKAMNPAMPVDGSEWWKSMAVQDFPSEIDCQVSLKFLDNDTSSIECSPSCSNEANLRVSMEMAVDPPSSDGLFSRHDSEFSADSGYVSLNEFPTNPTIKPQYLEALYSTKTSLAYFAKSALSRARSEYISRDGSLISVLSHLILEGDEFNIKYETVLPNFVKGDDDPTVNEIITKEERRHLSQKFSKSDDVDHQTTTQREINDLKIREYTLLHVSTNHRTQLQIIILAESLALHGESKDSQEQLDDATQEEYESLLASHLDRLSISSMLESENDFSEQFKREILLPLYLPRLLSPPNP
jgi:hypothetical protein